MSMKDFETNKQKKTSTQQSWKIIYVNYKDNKVAHGGFFLSVRADEQCMHIEQVLGFRNMGIIYTQC